ncbi:MAG: ABC transporter permease, partial [Gemmatimonadaceae bacterium]
MLTLVVRRGLVALVIAFIVANIAFLLVHAAPGDPFASVMEDPRVTPEVAARVRATYGLDRPLGEQYFRYLSRLARGDLGESFLQRRPVRDVLADAVPNTLLLMGSALLVAFTLGVALGAWQAYRRGSWADTALGNVSLAIQAVPEYLLAILLLTLFAYQLPVFPTSGMIDPVLSRLYSPAERVADVARHLALPGLTLVLIIGAGVARYQRAA